MNFIAHHFLFIVGILIILMPFLGFPSSWKTVFYVALGVCIMSLSFIKNSKRPAGKGWVLRREKAFVENSPTTGIKKRTVSKKPKEENTNQSHSVSEPVPSSINDITLPHTEEKQNGTLHGS